MSEIWFYHLQRQRLESALPTLLERSLERGWRAVVQTADEEREEALDALLWTYSDSSFLAHGRARDGDHHLQPVFLTCGADNPNGAQIRFYVGGADPSDALNSSYQRVIVIFDGADDDQLAVARAQWKNLRDSGAQLAYWRQSDDGRWEKIA